jgi:hypothetical protein
LNVETSAQTRPSPSPDSFIQAKDHTRSVLTLELPIYQADQVFLNTTLNRDLNCSPYSLTGNISVGCQEYPSSVATPCILLPEQSQTLPAFEDMHLLVITYPYYEERYDISMPYACDYLYS